MSELLITDIAELATPRGRAPRKADDQGRIARVAQAEVFCRDGRIAFAGPAADRYRAVGALPGVRRLSAAGGTVVPGFVDAHTHLPWAGDRADEFLARMAGADYRDIAAAGGGILATVRATRAASEAELTDNVRRRLDRMLRWGTTSAEVKSGYGLALDAERRQLRASAAAAEDHAIEITPTLLAAHETPPEHRTAPDRWIDEIVDAIIPQIAEDGLAAHCDVFCEHGVFDVPSSRRVLEAGRAYGLRPRLHADEFVDSGGAQLAAEIGAVSADHLVAVSDDGIAALASAGVIGVLLPAVSLFVRAKGFAPARRLIEAGVPIALATDCNPGSSHTESLPFIAALAVFHLGMTIEETLCAITLNAAGVLGRADEIGSVEVDKQADLVVLEGPSLAWLAYHPGVNPVRTVIKRGRVAAAAHVASETAD
ncbi:MAG: imidazolonepropionase [Acidobacteriota bacterium]